MTDSIRAQLLVAYADEHRDHLAAIRAALTAREGADFEEAFRHAHSLKGAARAVDLGAVVDIAHVLESLLEAWWMGEVVADDDLRRRVARACDAIEDLSAALLDGRPVPAANPALADLVDGLTAHGLPAPMVVAPIAEAEASGGGGHAPVAAATLRVEAEAANRLAATAALLLVEVERQHEVDRVLRRLSGELDELIERLFRAPAHAAPSGRDIAPALLSLRAAHDEALRDMAERDWALARAADALKEDVERLRMTAAEGVLGGFGPMLRELAADEGKEVRFDAEGLASLADREVLRSVSEAVMHLLLNAVHHGLERPAERVAAGKEPVGRLLLAVSVSGAHLVIRVEDDGRGIDAEAVGRAAVRAGLMTAEQAARTDPDRVRLLIFEPGFSTAEELSTSAGRGMGMPIVRQIVNSLQGSVELTSDTGRGTEIVLSVPVTVLAQRLLLVEAHSQIFALPTAAVERLAAVPVKDLRRVEGQLVTMVEGRDVPLHDLGGILGLPGQGKTIETACVVVMRNGRARLGLVVDRFINVHDLPVTALDQPLDRDARLAGTVVLEDGGLALVLSPAGLAAQAALPSTAAFAPLPGQPAAPLVLVVDDSITTRTLERSILETHGYRVDLAVDGRDALGRMAEARPDVVVSDIEMPRMDGFGLLAAMRGDPRFASVPVVLVSSRDAPADRERGLGLGADAYIVKTRFDQDDLLRTIGRLT